MSTIQRYCFLLIATLLAAFATTANAMHFYLKGSTPTCFGQDIQRDPSEKSVRVDVFYNLHYRNPQKPADDTEGAEMRVFLSNAEQKPIKGTESIVKLKSATSDLTSYYATQSGFYFFCFTVQAPKVASYKAEVEIIPTNMHQEEVKSLGGDRKIKKQVKGVVNKDEYLRKITTIDALLRSSEDEMSNLLTRQKEFDHTVKSTHNRVIYFTLANALIVFGTAGWQMLHLKRFFRSKKLV